MTGPRQERYRSDPGAVIGGEISVPGDKSISHRGLLLGGVAEGSTTIRGMLRGEDCLSTLRALRALGVRIEDDGDIVSVHGRGFGGLVEPAAVLDMGNSGTAMRLFCGLLAGQRFETELTGDASLRSRPMERVAEPLRAMGAQVTTTGGRAPVRIRGRHSLSAIDFTMPVASAQIKSAILLAGLQAEGRTTVTSPAVTRDHTERMLVAMGIRIEETGHRVSIVGPATPRGIALEVPGDFSSAAFFIVAAILAAREGLLIRNVGVNPTRIGLLTVLEQMGGHCELRHSRAAGAEPVADLYIHPSTLHGIDVPPELVPLMIDELPILFVAAAAAQGTTRVRGADELRHKESDRLAVMARGLEAIGAAVEETYDGLVIHGGHLQGGVVESAGDHRVAMAFSVAGAIARRPIQINDTAAVATSFPDFVATAHAAGLRVERLGGGE
jgi:3-phosphoshikimate 1-carboxyvinyltransferase